MALKNIFKRKDKPAAPVKPEEQKLAVASKKSVSAPAKAAAPVKKITDLKPIAHNIIKYPVITEKVTFLGIENKYVFAVSLKATKNEIKKAISEMYNVKPIKVNVININGKNVRWGRVEGKTNDWKKAIVTLKKGDKIELVEGV